MSHKFYSIRSAIRALESRFDDWLELPPRLVTREERDVYAVYLIGYLYQVDLSEFEQADLIRSIADHITRIQWKRDQISRYDRYANRRQIMKEIEPHIDEFIETAKRIARGQSRERTDDLEKLAA